MRWRDELAATLGAVRRVAPVGGGDINEASRAELVDGGSCS